MALSAFSGLYSEPGSNSCHKKIYVEKRFVEFCDKGISVRTNKSVVITKAVHVDERGVYYLKSEIIQSKRIGSEYRCPGRGCGVVCSSQGQLAAHMKYCRYCRN